MIKITTVTLILLSLFSCKDDNLIKDGKMKPTFTKRQQEILKSLDTISRDGYLGFSDVLNSELEKLNVGLVIEGENSFIYFYNLPLKNIIPPQNTNEKDRKMIFSLLPEFHENVYEFIFFYKIFGIQ